MKSFIKIIIFSIWTLPAFAQLISPSAAVRMGAVPSSCVAGSSSAIVVNNAGTDEILTCDNTGHYVLPPGGSTSVLTGDTNGAAGANVTTKSNGVPFTYATTPTVSGDGTLNATSGALAVSKIAGVAPGNLFPQNAPASIDVVGSNGSVLTQGFFKNTLNSGTGSVNQGFTAYLANLPISLQSYVDITAAGYVPVRMSAALNNTLSNISTTAGSPIVTCSSGCNWVSTGANSNVGNGITIVTYGTADRITTTIASVQSSTQITLAANADVTQTGRFGWWGTDSSVGVDAWFAVMKASNKCGYVPAITTVATGGYGYFTGSGLSGWNNPCFRGDNGGASLIYGGSTNSIVDGNEFQTTAHITDMGFIGFTNPVRNRLLTQNVTFGPLEYARNFFRFYQGAAISFNSNDITYYDINNNTFWAQNSINPMGVAIYGSDFGYIGPNNHFLLNAFHVKLGGGGSATNTFANDMIQFIDGTNRRAAVWLQPSTTSSVNAVAIKGNKMGNEHLSALDSRVLAADSTTPSVGNYWGDTQPITTASTGWITNLDFDNKLVGANSGGNNSLLYSYAGNVINNHFQGIVDNPPPVYCMEFDGVVTPGNSSLLGFNRCGDWAGLNNAPGNHVMLQSNIPGYGMTTDPSGQSSYSDPTVLTPYTTGSNQAGYIALLQNGINAFTIPASHGSKATITDSALGQDAITYTLDSSGAGLIYNSLNASPTLAVGMPTWVEVDLQSGTANSIVVNLLNANSTTVLASWPVTNLTSTWHRYKFRFVLTADPTPQVPAIVAFTNTPQETSALTLNIGRVRVYQANEPLGGGLFQGITSIIGIPAITSNISEAPIGLELFGGVNATDYTAMDFWNTAKNAGKPIARIGEVPTTNGSCFDLITSNNFTNGLTGTGFRSCVNSTDGNTSFSKLTVNQGIIDPLGVKNFCTHGSNGTCGVVTLTSGTATVATTNAAVLAAAGGAGDGITLTIQTCSSCGYVAVGTVTAGTSFVINSYSAPGVINATDSTSTVKWEIGHIN